MGKLLVGSARCLQRLGLPRTSSVLRGCAPLVVSRGSARRWLLIGRGVGLRNEGNAHPAGCWILRWESFWSGRSARCLRRLGLPRTSSVLRECAPLVVSRGSARGWLLIGKGVGLWNEGNAHPAGCWILRWESFWSGRSARCLRRLGLPRTTSVLRECAPLVVSRGSARRWLLIGRGVGLWNEGNAHPAGCWILRWESFWSGRSDRCLRRLGLPRTARCLSRLG